MKKILFMCILTAFMLIAAIGGLTISRLSKLNHEKEFETCMRDLEEVKIEEVDKRILCVIVLK